MGAGSAGTEGVCASDLAALDHPHESHDAIPRFLAAVFGVDGGERLVEDRLCFSGVRGRVGVAGVLFLENILIRASY